MSNGRECRTGENCSFGSTANRLPNAESWIQVRPGGGSPDGGDKDEEEGDGSKEEKEHRGDAEDGDTHAEDGDHKEEGAEDGEPPPTALTSSKMCI